MNDMKEYITPTIKVVAFHIESGFLGSVDPLTSSFPLFRESGDGFNGQNQQVWGDEPSNSLFNFSWNDE